MAESGKGVVTVEQRGPVAVLILDNQAMRNALTQAMWRAFPPLLAQLAADDTAKVVLVRGAGTTFSAGAEISTVTEILHDPSTGHSSGGDVTLAEEALSAFPKPTIAAIDGYCVGGGWQIAGACDLRLSTSRAHLAVTPAKLGILYPLSGIRRLVSLVGPATAKYLLFSADFIPADEALGLGLVNKVLPEEGFHEAVEHFAAHLAKRSQLSHQGHKALINGLVSGANMDQLSSSWQQEMAAAQDAALGIAAFLAKETPHFTWTGPRRL